MIFQNLFIVLGHQVIIMAPNLQFVIFTNMLEQREIWNLIE